MTATVEFHDRHWNIVKTVTRTFPDRDRALDWLLSQKGSLVGWIGDKSFAIVMLEGEK